MRKQNLRETCVLVLCLLPFAAGQPIFNNIPDNRPAPGSPVFVRTPPPNSGGHTGGPIFAPIPTPPVFFPQPSVATPSPIRRKTVASVIQEAVNRVNTEDATMRRRLNQGPFIHCWVHWYRDMPEAKRTSPWLQHHKTNMHQNIPDLLWPPDKMEDVDKNMESFSNPDPLLFSESPENAESFSRPSRIINWIDRLLRKYGMTSTLASALASSSGRAAVSCPYRLPVQSTCIAQARYRTVDGTCNNLDNPLWGAAFTPFIRRLPARYDIIDDRGDSTRRASISGSLLPNPRVISTSFHQPPLTRSDDSIFSMLITIFGQFVSHDITDRAPTKGYGGSVMKCCNQQIGTPAGFCENIPVPRRDEFRPFKGDCLEFPRSLEVTGIGCDSGVREQLNQASSYIDGGAIYGATVNKSRSLRQFKGGLLMISVPNELPIIPHGNTQATTRGFAFFAAGDNRVNEFIGLIAMETVWVREHNRIAKALSGMNLHWSDETIFQETRRIIVAMIQHITYKEYLPAILGPTIVQKYELLLLVKGYYDHYDPQVDPGLSNAFATAAMRFGHSMLRTTYGLRNRGLRPNGDTPLDLKDAFFRPQTYLTNENPLIRGMASEPSKMCDRVLSGSVINNLYETDLGTGSDLAAANIQRGRDHGLPSYTEWRRLFGLSVPRSFSTSSTGFANHDADAVRRMRSLYSNAGDVDLFTGGVSETPVRQGAVGPLFANIIGQQFKALKKGDRFWYETSSQPQAFTKGQLKQIRTITLAKVLCDTFGFDTIQERVFFLANPISNPTVRCDSLASINLDYWRAAA